MPRLLLIVLLLAHALGIAQEPPAPRRCGAPRAWLGLHVAKPDDSTAAQLPSLPPGIGFVVRTIDPDGPAAAAGLREFDVLCKIGDQLLVNEGQMAALLRLHQPGDEITLSGFRAGKALDFTVKLGETPATAQNVPGEWLDAAVLPGDATGPMRVVNLAEKLASFTNAEGTAEVRRDGAFYQVKITTPEGKPLYQGELPPDGGLARIPQPWQSRVAALRRGLDHALDSRLTPIRQPRPRVVPPPQAGP